MIETYEHAAMRIYINFRLRFPSYLVFFISEFRTTVDFPTVSFGQRGGIQQKPCLEEQNNVKLCGARLSYFLKINGKEIEKMERGVLFKTFAP